MTDLVFPAVLESLQRRIAEKGGNFIQLIQHYQPVRQELLQRRTEQTRKHFSPPDHLPTETQAIREAAWSAETQANKVLERVGVAQSEWVDFEADPELSSRKTLALYQMAMTSQATFIRTHSLFHEEREILFEGRHVSGFLLNLALLTENHVLMIPKLENRFEARKLSELLHVWQGLSGVYPRIGVEFETLQSIYEADEIFFELKEFIVTSTFDPLDYLSNLIRRLSGSREGLLNPFREERRFALVSPVQNYLRALSKHRSITWVDHPTAAEVPYEAGTSFFPKLPTFRTPSEEEVRSLIREGLEYLVEVLESVETTGAGLGKACFSRFEFCRSVLWQWIHHDAVSEESYFKYRDLEGARMTGGFTEIASQLLDSLLLNGNFVEFAGAYFDLHRRLRTA